MDWVSWGRGAFLLNYLPILIFLVFALFFSILLLCLPFAVTKLSGKINRSSHKSDSYECGFDQVGDARSRFDIRFYLVAILFVIFDLEIAFLIPWALSLKMIGIGGFYSMVIFLMVLTIGLIYEWKIGALNWH